jgi:hypothetical protein
LIGYDVGDGEVVEKAKPLIERILGRRKVPDGDRDTVALDTSDSWDMEMPSDAERDGRFGFASSKLRLTHTHTRIDVSF